MVSSDHVEPGSSGRINATVDTVGKKGRLIKHVTVYSNDKTSPVVSLSMTLQVE